MATNISRFTPIYSNNEVSNGMSDRSDRTLIYGYTCDRDTFHLYLKDGEFNLVVYKGRKYLQAYWVRELNLKLALPDKRVYPDRCDFEFCKLLQRMGADIPFTSWTDLPDHLLENKFHGKLITDFHDIRELETTNVS